ncbi:biotin/lipoyl-containing protein [Actinomyces lilanjuaniae]|uniref:biotin/lipoyl-containing protein n=1 Tax=Actinomyces lilanjuaniae TaxID=2321394 RepID=UPI0013C4EEB6
MSESVKMPALGESVTEGTVSSWLKAVGDTVEVDEPLLEVATDKVDTEVPSPVSGTVLEILVAEDETAEVGTVLAVIGDPAEAGGSPSPLLLSRSPPHQRRSQAPQQAPRPRRSRRTRLLPPDPQPRELQCLPAGGGRV